MFSRQISAIHACAESGGDFVAGQSGTSSAYEESSAISGRCFHVSFSLNSKSSTHGVTKEFGQLARDDEAATQLCVVGVGSGSLSIGVVLAHLDPHTWLNPSFPEPGIGRRTRNGNQSKISGGCASSPHQPTTANENHLAGWIWS